MRKLVKKQNIIENVLNIIINKKKIINPAGHYLSYKSQQINCLYKKSHQL